MRGIAGVPRLHLIGPLGGVTIEDYLRIAPECAAGGVDGVHLRAPGTPTDDLLRAAIALRARIGRAALIVNDRIDVALLAGADAVQLGERSFAPSDARRLVGERLLIGRSIHDVDGARRAAADGSDYLLAGHVFDTPSKAGEPGRGLGWLTEVVAAVDIPVIALGGITVERIPSVLHAGAHGVAMGRELLLASDPVAAARAAWRAFDVRDEATA